MTTNDARLNILLSLRDQATQELRNTGREMRAEQRRLINAQASGDREVQRQARQQIGLLRVQQRETRDYVRDIRDQERATRRASNEQRSFGDNLRAVQGSLLAIGAAIAGATGVVAGMTRLATATAQAADQLDVMHQRTGLNVETLSELRFITQRTGASFSDLEPAIRRVQRTIVEGGEGAASFADALERVGLNVSTIQGLSADEQFFTIAAAIGELETAAERTTAAFDLFGDSGTRLLPIVNQGAAGIAQLRNRASELGATMDEESVAAGVELTNVMNDLSTSVTGLRDSLGFALMPVIETGTENLTDFTIAVRALNGELSREQEIIRDLQAGQELGGGALFDPLQGFLLGVRRLTRPEDFEGTPADRGQALVDELSGLIEGGFADPQSRIDAILGITREREQERQRQQNEQLAEQQNINARALRLEENHQIRRTELVNDFLEDIRGQHAEFRQQQQAEEDRQREEELRAEEEWQERRQQILSDQFAAEFEAKQEMEREKTRIEEEEAEARMRVAEREFQHQLGIIEGIQELERQQREATGRVSGRGGSFIDFSGLGPPGIGGGIPGIPTTLLNEALGPGNRFGQNPNVTSGAGPRSVPEVEGGTGNVTVNLNMDGDDINTGLGRNSRRHRD